MLIIFSIHDSKMETFNRPFCMPAVGAAIRAFQDEVNTAGSEMNKHPEDYALFDLGTFDEDLGILNSNSTPIKISEAKDLIYREKNHASE